MSDIQSFEASERHSLEGSEPPAKRRKVRKGTKSCWECKPPYSLSMCNKYPVVKAAFGSLNPSAVAAHENRTTRLLACHEFCDQKPNIAYGRPET